PLLRRDVPRAGAARTHPAHGPVRRPEPARRDADDDHLEKGLLRNRVEHRSGRDSASDPARGLLPRLAGIAGPVGETRRGGDPRLTPAAAASAHRRPLVPVPNDAGSLDAVSLPTSATPPSAPCPRLALAGG